MKHFFTLKKSYFDIELSNNVIFYKYNENLSLKSTLNFNFGIIEKILLKNLH